MLNLLIISNSTARKCVINKTKLLKSTATNQRQCNTTGLELGQADICRTGLYLVSDLGLNQTVWHGHDGFECESWV